MLKKIQEDSCFFYAPVGKISKALPVFYNPDMALNRDISILLLSSVSNKNLRILDLLAGSGIRSLRFIASLKKGKIKELTVNDSSKKAVETIKKNLSIKRNPNPNKIKPDILNKDANELLIFSEGFDYIDIDPFGSPNPFLDNAVKRLSRDGILAVTATDTSALSGSFINACQRKYWATPLKNYMMHETGIRILIRKVQLVAAQYDKSLVPIFSHSTRHYLRVYFRCSRGKIKADKILSSHKYLLFCKNCLTVKTSKQNKDICCKKKMIWAGPVWTGQLWDKRLASRMLKKADKSNKDLFKLLDIISKESRISQVGFYSIPVICKKLRKSLPKQELILEKIKKAGYNAAQTHFLLDGIRSNIEINKLKKIIKSI